MECFEVTNHTIDYDGSRLSPESSLNAERLADMAAVSEFSDAMNKKLVASAGKGRRGWRDCHVDVLWQMLRDHIEKGDPVDIGNFAMMIYHNTRAST